VAYLPPSPRAEINLFLRITANGKSAERISIRYLRSVNCASSAKKKERKNKTGMAGLEGRFVTAV
jgi:hypothetical protein